MPSKTSSFSIGSLPLLGSYRVQSFDARSKLNEDVQFFPLKPGDLGAAPTVEKLHEILMLTLRSSLDYHREQFIVVHEAIHGRDFHSAGNWAWSNNSFQYHLLTHVFPAHSGLETNGDCFGLGYQSFY